MFGLSRKEKIEKELLGKSDFAFNWITENTFIDTNTLSENVRSEIVTRAFEHLSKKWGGGWNQYDFTADCLCYMTIYFAQQGDETKTRRSLSGALMFLEENKNNMTNKIYLDLDEGVKEISNSFNKV